MTQRRPTRSDVPIVEAARHVFADKRDADFVSVPALLAKGEKVDHKDKWGRTALMEAAAVNNAGLVAFLIEKGATVDLKDNTKSFN